MLKTPLALALFPRVESNPRLQFLMDAMLVVIGSLLVGLLAQIRFYLPMNPVPVTGQTLGVLLVGSTLGFHRGTLSIALYLIEGLLGLPVFASSTVTGLEAFLLPSSGYLFGFVLASACVGQLAQRGWDRSWGKAWAMFLLGHSCVFLLGVPWLAKFVGWEKAFLLGYVPFIPGEIVKTTLAGALMSGCRKWVDRK